MTKEYVSDTLWTIIAALLPAEPPKPRGGRPRLSDRAALNGILFVLHTSIGWEHLPQELGWGSGMTCWPTGMLLESGNACITNCYSGCMTWGRLIGHGRRGMRRASPRKGGPGNGG
jgi:transposase